MADQHAHITVERTSPLRRLVVTAHSLQFKATVLVVALTLCVTAAVSTYFLQSSIQFVNRQHHEQLVQSTALLAKAMAIPWAQDDLDTLQSLASDAANGMPLLYVVIFDANGNELAAAASRDADHHLLDHARQRRPAELPVLGTPLLYRIPGNRDAYLDMAYPISVRHSADNPTTLRDTRLLGYVRSGAAANRWQQAISSKLDLVVGVGTVATAVAILLGFLLVRRIVSPLIGLTDAMLQFSRGELDVRSRVSRRDEIGQLGRAFNRMADQHQQNHEHLLRLNVELEERVARRTKQLRDLAARDPVTGVYNRRHFGEVLERSFSEAIRYQNDLACLMVDLDDFKAVNDAHGHQIGDRLLVLTTATITRSLRSADVAARYGGDEFIVLLPQTDAENARVLATRIMERFARDLEAELPEVHSSLSVGIASLHSVQASNAESLVRSADHALYEAKGAGKNRIVTAAVVAKPTPT